MSGSNDYHQVPSAPPLESVDDSDVAITGHSSDADVKSVFGDPEFLRKLVGKMDDETRELYEKELSKKTEDRLQKAEQTKLYHENKRQKWLDQHNKERAVLGKILVCIWIIYLAVVGSILLINLLGNHIGLISDSGMGLIQTISSYTLSNVFAMSFSLAVPFAGISFFIMIFFTDF